MLGTCLTNVNSLCNLEKTPIWVIKHIPFTLWRSTYNGNCLAADRKILSIGENLHPRRSVAFTCFSKWTGWNEAWDGVNRNSLVVRGVDCLDCLLQGSWASIGQDLSISSDSHSCFFCWRTCLACLVSLCTKDLVDAEAMLSVGSIWGLADMHIHMIYNDTYDT